MRPRLRRRAGGDNDLSLRKVFSPLVTHQRGRMVLMSVASILGGFCEAAILLLLAQIAVSLAGGDSSVHVDVLFVNATASVWWLVAAGTLLVFLRIALQWVSIVTAARTSTSVMLDIRIGLTEDLLAANWAFQSRQREGRLQELISSYAAGAAGAVGAITNGLTNAFNLAALLLAALLVTPVAAIGAALAGLAIGALLRPLRAAVRRRSAAKAAANLALSTGVTEFGSTLQEVRIFGVEGAAGGRVEALARKANRAELRSSYLEGAIPAIYQAAAMLLVLGSLSIAFAVGTSGLADLGAVMLILLRSLTYAQGVQGAIQGLHAAAPFVETITDEQHAYRDAMMGREGAPLTSVESIAFDNVSYGYEPGVLALEGASFSTARGELIGIVGPSGAGKSTLVQLLLRLRDPTSGSVLVNGRDLRSFDLDDWFRRVTFVSQDTRLFSGTVHENIAFFRDVTDEQVEHAARRAHVHDDILKLAHGYDTSVGERGSQLSGGQRQRVCIARALLDEPDVVVFDEPTSALDVRSEALMRDTMQELASDRTVFIVAHRLSTLSACNRIMVVLDGEIQGFDEPESLERSNRFYEEALKLSGLK